MNPRVLELIKNPKNIQLEDLSLLKEEIHTFPYIQNIRALHLYGVHLYEKESYQKELSTTAAYTTDKKILYQLINGKIKQEPKPGITEEKQPFKAVDKGPRYSYKGFPIKREETPSEKNEGKEDDVCMLQDPHEVKAIYVSGERNRILFEGEENFHNDKNPETIDIESTFESGTLVTQRAEPAVINPVQDEKEEIKAEAEENIGENFTPEVRIDEDEISSEAGKINNEEIVSFQAVETLLPEVNVQEDVAEESPVSEISENENGSVSDKEEAADKPDAELSFHGMEAFMPDVKIQANNEETVEAAEVSQPNVNKHEEEMRRLIEEVEKKMKETKSIPQQEQEESDSAPDHEISFAETQSFHFWSTSEERAEPQEVKAEPEQPKQEEAYETPASIEEDSKEAVEEKAGEALEIQSVWKPMSLESNVPDSLISKSAEVTVPVMETFVGEDYPVDAVEAKIKIEKPESAEEESEDKTEVSHEDILPVVEEAPELMEDQPENNKDSEESPAPVALKEEAPVMNVSFFGTDISTLKVEEKQKENKEEPVEKETVQEGNMKNTTQSQVDSNVPGFINTWQSWLKIDRTGTEKAEKEKTVIIEKVIETFIENNPRISQLKEESSYVVKEKNDDISHLMTETLANLYFEQKLYTKAIKAFEILIKKNPDKKEYFESRIQEIKDFRSKN